MCESCAYDRAQADPALAFVVNEHLHPTAVEEGQLTARDQTVDVPEAAEDSLGVVTEKVNQGRPKKGAATQ